MANDTSDRVPQVPSHPTSEQEPPRLDTGRLEELPREKQTCEDPSPSTAHARKKTSKRKDRGHLHATRHGVLSCSPLESLQIMSDDIKKYRRIERRFREALKPVGEIALMFFDRFFSSYLRCVLIGRMEARAFAPRATSTNSSGVLPVLSEQYVPTLVLPNGPEDTSIARAIPPDLFRELVIVQRYDRHFSREMYLNLHLASCSLLGQRLRASAQQEY